MKNVTVKQVGEPASALSDFEKGVLVGLLLGEGTFGGDGKQAHVVLRMHTRHERLFRWIAAKVTGGKLYGPYHHGGRDYFQWMLRGTALKRELMPLLDSSLEELDEYAFGRYAEMKRKYRLAR